MKTKKNLWTRTTATVRNLLQGELVSEPTKRHLAILDAVTRDPVKLRIAQTTPEGHALVVSLEARGVVAMHAPPSKLAEWRALGVEVFDGPLAAEPGQRLLVVVDGRSVLVRHMSDLEPVNLFGPVVAGDA